MDAPSPRSGPRPNGRVSKRCCTACRRRPERRKGDTMAERTAVEKAVLAGREREPAVKLHRWPVQIEYNVVNRALTLEGEVDNIIAKRRAYECVSRVDGVDGIMDRLRVRARGPRGEGAIRAWITHSILDEPSLRDCALHVYHKGIMETLRVPPGGKDVIGVTVEGGVVEPS